MNVQLHRCVVPLGEICDINIGRTPSRTESAFWRDGDIPWASISDLTAERHLLTTKEMITRHAVDACRMRPVAAGTVLMSFKLSIGRVAIAGRDLFTNEAIAALPVKDSSRVCPSYLARALETIDFENIGDRAAKGRTLNKKSLATLSIPLPPLGKQKRIAAILDQADALRRLRRRAFERLNALAQSIFHDMFGDFSGIPETTLAELVRSNDRINYGVVQPGEEVQGGVPLLRAGDVLSPHLDPTQFRTIAPSVDQRHRKSRLVGDELLVACVGSIGAVGMAHKGLKGVNIARAVARLPLDPKRANRIFMAEQIKTERVQNYFNREIRLVAQPTLNIKQISDTPVYLPPMSDQERFARYYDEVLIRSASMMLSGKKLDILFQSLQHRAFAGDI